MTEQSPHQPTLERLTDQRQLFQRLSHFQESLTLTQPIRPLLSEVLQAAQPAFEAGFAYSASIWQGELQVTIHHGSAELGSCAPAEPTSYSDTCARLLAGLLGIPLLEGDQAGEPEVCMRTAPEVVRPQLQQEPPKAVEPEPEPEPEPEDEEFDELGDPEPSADIHRTLTEQEKDAAVAMVKALPADRRRTFSKSFREVFAVPEDAKQIVPFMTELQHLQFIDRYTVEASGGIAA